MRIIPKQELAVGHASGKLLFKSNNIYLLKRLIDYFINNKDHKLIVTRCLSSKAVQGFMAI
jgi:hypothetical protein